jgi:hypothetical protein
MSSEPDESMRSGSERMKHPNCPSCMELGTHVCYACKDCLWYENHAEEYGIRARTGAGG